MLIRNELSLQTVTYSAITRYAELLSIFFRGYVPYSNQQGLNPNQSPADMVGSFHTKAIMLEFKAVDASQKPLCMPGSFTTKQHELLKTLESLGLLIYFAYSSIEDLEWHEPSALRAIQILDAVITRKPSDLYHPKTSNYLSSKNKRLLALLNDLIWRKTSSNSAYLLLSAYILKTLITGKGEISNGLLIIISSYPGSRNRLDVIDSGTLIAIAESLLESKAYKKLAKQTADELSEEKKNKNEAREKEIFDQFVLETRQRHKIVLGKQSGNEGEEGDEKEESFTAEQRIGGKAVKDPEETEELDEDEDPDAPAP